MMIIMIITTTTTIIIIIIIKTRHDLVGKVVHWRLCKKFKFDYTNK